MNTTPIRHIFLLGAICAFVLTSRAQVIEFRATINAAQEVPATSSSASGSAILLYDIEANTIDVFVSLNGFSNVLTAAHVHEAEAGANGPPVVTLATTGFSSSGGTVTAAFRGLRYPGDRLKLLQSGAYLNFHSAPFPDGEVRGQLIARPKRLVSNCDVAQEQAAFPNVNLAGANLHDFGGAVMLYDPAAHTVRLRLSIYNFNNPFSNSHFHEGAPGVSGPVRVNLGNNANAGGYNTANGHISGTFDISMGTTDPFALLSGQIYLNFHSTAFPGGELRGQVVASDEVPGTRFANLAVRGFVGSGEQVLIQGITVNGPDPIRALITAKGPWLAAYGVTGVLANPRLALFDSGGRQIAANDDVGTIAADSELAMIPGIPTNAVESALVVVLPPGNYTAIVSAATGTGIALLEVNDLRTPGGLVAASANDAAIAGDGAGARVRAASFTGGERPVLELCAGLPLAAVARR